MALDIDQSLLTLSGASRTAELYVNMVRGVDTLRLQSICRDELKKLDDRFDIGEVAEAATQLAASLYSTRKPRSRM